MIADGQVYSGGVPTAPYIDRIMDAIPDPQPGDVIKYDDIINAIGEPIAENRLRTIYAAYRRRLEHEREFVVVNLRNVGYMVADPANRVTVAAKMVDGGCRRIQKGAQIAANTDRRGLTDEARKQCDYLTRVNAQLIGIARTQARILELPEPKLTPKLTRSSPLATE